MKFFWCEGIFSRILISKLDVKMNLSIITKNHAADPEIGFRTKSILKTYAAAMPTVWELKILCCHSDSRL